MIVSPSPDELEHQQMRDSNVPRRLASKTFSTPFAHASPSSKHLAEFETDLFPAARVDLETR
jgi:hypothetical protein